MRVLVVLAVVALAAAASVVVHAMPIRLSADVQSEFDAFARRFNKSYARPHERNHRAGIFGANLAAIMKHNFQEPTPSFLMGVNQFADLTASEWSARIHGRAARNPLLKKKKATNNNNHGRRRVVRRTVTPASPAPPSLDWRTKITIAEPQNQGECESDWAVVPVDMISGDAEIKSGGQVQLSWQEVMDCDTGSSGCDGGSIDSVYGFILNNSGIQSAATYPNTGMPGNCAKNPAENVVSLSGYTDVAAGDEAAIMTAVQTQLVSIMVDASGANFQFYESGVLGGACGTNLDHALLLVGYGTQDGTNYWILRNDWGTSWGLNGYILIQRDTNECGLADGASFATLN